jgi:uncharacterized protein
VIQPSSFCNIDCRYCYVPGRDNRAVIKPETLEKILLRVFTDEQVANDFRLVWHNGEPLALGIEFYRSANSIISRVNRAGKKFRQCIQTNGTMLNQEWIELFREYDIAASVSIDGPQEIHDLNRVTRSGRGTHQATMQGIKLLRENHVPLVGLCVVTNDSLAHGRAIMQFFIEEGFVSLGLIIEEPWGGNPQTSFSCQSSAEVVEEQFRVFVSDVVETWHPHRSQIEIREFQDILQAMRKFKLDQNAFAQQEDATPLTVLSFNRDGGITTFSPQMIAGTDDCQDRFIVANIHDLLDLKNIADVPKHQQIANEVAIGIECCRNSCGYFNLCGGGAPASKFYEHGNFACSETRECRFSKQLIVDVLLDTVPSLGRKGC